MPFCTSCREEYRPGFTVCSDCGAPLVAELPREEPVPSEGEGGSHGGWDMVAEVGQRYEADLIADHLRDAGIEAEVVDQTFRQEPLTRIAAFSVVRVLVPVGRADEARRVLSEPMETLPEDAEVGAPEAEPGRSEGESRHTIRNELLGVLRTLVELILGRHNR
jgi:hypothetical protein